MASRGTVLISGAGIAGPALAYWLLHHGFVPTLVERAPAPRIGGYLIDFWGVGYDVAERMGLLPKLKEDAYWIEDVRMVDASGRRISGFDARVFWSASNNRFFSVSRGDLTQRIYETVADRTECIFGDSIAALSEDSAGVTVTFEHAAARRFDLVAGADGLHSKVRSLVFGVPAHFETFLGYYVAAFTVRGYPHRDEAAYVSYTVPGRQIARCAMRDGRSAFFFMLAADRLLPVAHDDESAHRAVLRERFGGIGWESDEILDALDTADDLYFDAVSQVRMNDWSRGRVVLLGDAAYCPSLLAGQGSAFAMAGAYLLAHSLGATPQDHTAAFENYQHRFKPFVDKKQRGAEYLGGWLAPRTATGLWVRNLVTNVMNIPYLAEFLIARTIGESIPLP